jgi:hypothetical protein
MTPGPPADLKEAKTKNKQKALAQFFRKKTKNLRRSFFL